MRKPNHSKNRTQVRSETIAAWFNARAPPFGKGRQHESTKHKENMYE